MSRYPSVLLTVVVWAFASLVPAQIPAPKAPPEPIRGALVIAGGGALPEEVWDTFTKLAGGPAARLVIVPTAGADADIKQADALVEVWKKRGGPSVTLLHTRDRKQANDPSFVKPLTQATGVWFGGGDPARLSDAYLGTAVEAQLHKLLERGGVVGGTSGGAAALSKLMIAGGKIPAQVTSGFGLLPNFVLEQHLLQHNRLDRLLDTLARHAGWVGLGVDEQTAVVVQGRTLSVIGKSYALACLAAGAGRPASCQVLKPGDKADLIALARAALERTRPAHPAAKALAPEVAKGALIIGGGGGMPEDVWRKFVDLAGGPKAKVVVIPTALDFPTKGEPGEAIRLKKAGADVRVLHAASRAAAEAPDFLQAFQEASGVWFTGGRQWRLVDAYLDTAAADAMHQVLQRGGVIGGSSAGASIQADYMVRGDPLGNLKMMAEGYERGLGFLRGVAIDQHFFKRKRPPDMTELMARYPQLLGIGIDEQGALLVQGAIMEVLGKGSVAVYDRTRPQNGPVDYEVLPPGTKYNLKTRQKLVGK